MKIIKKFLLLVALGLSVSSVFAYDVKVVNNSHGPITVEINYVGCTTDWFDVPMSETKVFHTSGCLTNRLKFTAKPGPNADFRINSIERAFNPMGPIVAVISDTIAPVTLGATPTTVGTQVIVGGTQRNAYDLKFDTLLGWSFGIQFNLLQ